MRRCLLFVSLSLYGMQPLPIVTISKSPSISPTHSRKPSFVGSDLICIHVDRDDGKDIISTLRRPQTPQPSISVIPTIEELMEKAQHLYGLKYKKPMSSKLMPHVAKKIEQESKNPSGDMRYFIDALAVCDSPSSEYDSPKSVDEIAEWLNGLITESVDEAMQEEEERVNKAEMSLKERELELEMSYRRAKLAAISNIATALITATVTVLTMQISKEEK